jgi:hypothetical protein
MHSPAKKRAQIELLREEIDAIHFANSLYWKRADGPPTRDARAEYQRRLDRLEEIRKELSKLKEPP